MFDFVKMKSNLQAFGKEVEQLQARIEEKRQERQRIELSPLPRQDLADMLDEWIDQEAAQFLPNLRAGIDFMVRKPNLETIGHNLGLLEIGSGGIRIQGQIPTRNLCFLLRDTLKSGFRIAVEQMEYPDDQIGPPRAKRPAMLAKLDSEITALEQKERELRDYASEAGIKL